MSTSVFAADFEQPAVEDTTFDWEGLYLGVFGSYNTFDSDMFDGVFDDSVDMDGLGAGLLLGYNFQADSLIFGIEGDIALLDIEDDSDDLFDSDQGVDFGYGARLRLGYAFDNTMLFVAGGIAAAEFDGDMGVYSFDDTITGFQIGGGIEHAFSESWTIRADYYYTDYEDINDDDMNVDVDGSQFRIGVNYLF